MTVIRMEPPTEPPVVTALWFPKPPKPAQDAFYRKLAVVRFDVKRVYRGVDGELYLRLPEDRVLN